MILRRVGERVFEGADFFYRQGQADFASYVEIRFRHVLCFILLFPDEYLDCLVTETTVILLRLALGVRAARRKRATPPVSKPWSYINPANFIELERPVEHFEI